ncbi:MAG: pre-peptidase C-terminal domain-containing protein [Anaerolineae bacterium]|nr:pre-peptidase C-terminal domain-containing protein [Anaerolineae bacterium]
MKRNLEDIIKLTNWIIIAILIISSYSQLSAGFLQQVDSVYTSGNNDYQEPNNTFNQAGILADDIITASINGFDDPNDYYRIELIENKQYTFTLSFLGRSDLDLYLYSPSQERIAHSLTEGASTEKIRFKPSKSGTYYVLVAAFATEGIQNYTLTTGYINRSYLPVNYLPMVTKGICVLDPCSMPTITPTPAPNPCNNSDCREANNSFSEAQPINPNEKVLASVNKVTDLNDYYRIALQADKRYTVRLNFSGNADLDLYIYGSDKSEIIKSKNIGPVPEEVILHTSKDDVYYVLVAAFNTNGSQQYELVVEE